MTNPFSSRLIVLALAATLFACNGGKPADKNKTDPTTGKTKPKPDKPEPEVRKPKGPPAADAAMLATLAEALAKDPGEIKGMLTPDWSGRRLELTVEKAQIKHGSDALAAKLGDARAKERWPVVMAAAWHESPVVRRRALLLIGRDYEPEQADALSPVAYQIVDLLKDPDPLVKRAALFALSRGASRVDEAVAALTEMIGSQDAVEQCGAVCGLANIATPACCEGLLEALGSTDRSAILQTVRWGLSRVKPDSGNVRRLRLELRNRSVTVQVMAAKLLARIDDIELPQEVGPILLGEAKRDDADALRALPRTGIADDALADVLFKAVIGGDGKMLRAYEDVIKSGKAPAKLLRLLERALLTEPDQRTEVYRGAAPIGIAAAPMMIRAFILTARGVRTWCTSSLAALGKPVVPLLVEKLDKEKGTLPERIGSALALARIECPEAAPTKAILLGVSVHPDDTEVRELLVGSLAVVGKDDARAAARMLVLAREAKLERKLIPAFDGWSVSILGRWYGELLGAKEAFDRRVGIRGLARIGDFEALTAMLGTSDVELRPVVREAMGAKGAVGALVKALGHADEGIRFSAAHLLAMGHDSRKESQAAVPTLVKMLERTGDDAVCRRGIEGLGRLDVKSASVAKLLGKALLADQGKGELAAEAGTVLASMGEGALPAVPMLERGLASEHKTVRIQVIHVLWRIGKRALPSIRKALGDSDKEVKDLAKMAVEALEQR